MHLLTDSKESRKIDTLETLHAFHEHVKELQIKQAVQDAKNLDNLGFVVKIHRHAEVVVEAIVKKPGELFTETLTPKVSESEYIILKCLEQMPLHRALERLGRGGSTPLHVKERARGRRILWNALSYIRRMKDA